MKGIITHVKKYQHLPFFLYALLLPSFLIKTQNLTDKYRNQRETVSLAASDLLFFLPLKYLLLSIQQRAVGCVYRRGKM